MIPWDVLGIAPTTDEAAVRRAYANLLRANRPDDDMNAFSALRNAYEQALSICRRSQLSTDAYDFLVGYDEQQMEPEPLPEFKTLSTEDLFVCQFHTLARDYASYPDQTQWITFLNTAFDLNFWERDSLGKTMALVLCDYPLLPLFVWDKLEEIFNWERNRGRLSSQYHDADLNWLRQKRNTARLLRTEEIINCQGAPQYLDALIRFYAHSDAIKRVEVSDWLHGLHIERKKLPSAMRLHFSLLKSIGDWKTLSTPDTFFLGNDDDHFIALLRGEALRRMGDYDSASKVYENVLEQHPNHADALRWSAFCLECAGDTALAIGRYQLLLDILPDDVYSRCALERLTFSDIGNHRSWRDWFFTISDGLGKIIRFVVIVVMVLVSIMSLFYYFRFFFG